MVPVPHKEPTDYRNDEALETFYCKGRACSEAAVEPLENRCCAKSCPRSKSLLVQSNPLMSRPDLLYASLIQSNS